MNPRVIVLTTLGIRITILMAVLMAIVMAINLRFFLVVATVWLWIVVLDLGVPVALIVTDTVSGTLWYWGAVL